MTDAIAHATVAADLADDASRAFVAPCSAKERHAQTATLALLSLAHSCAAIAQVLAHGKVCVVDGNRE